MPIIEAIFFVAIMLPWLIFKSGRSKLKSHLDTYGWQTLPYYLLVIALILLVAALITGHRW